jgi:hypothetical protein
MSGRNAATMVPGYGLSILDVIATGHRFSRHFLDFGSDMQFSQGVSTGASATVDRPAGFAQS